MFIYLVALVATSFIIFGLLHPRCLYDWLQSPISYFSNLYNELTRRSMIEAPLQNENLENNLPAASLKRPLDVNNEWREHDNISGLFMNTERLSDPILEEHDIKLRNLHPVSNFENISSAETNKDVTRSLQQGIVGTTEDNAISTFRHRGKENIFQSLKNSNEKMTTNQLNTQLIHHLIMKEAMKASEVQQKLVDSLKDKLTDSPIQMDHPSPSKLENEDNHNKSKPDDII